MSATAASTQSVPFAKLPSAVASLVCTFLAAIDHARFAATSDAAARIARLPTSSPTELRVVGGTTHLLATERDSDDDDDELPPAMLRLLPRRVTVRLRWTTETASPRAHSVDAWVVPRLLGAFGATLQSVTLNTTVALRQLVSLAHLTELDCEGVTDDDDGDDGAAVDSDNGTRRTVSSVQSLAIRRPPATAFGGEWPPSTQCRLSAFSSLTRLELGFADRSSAVDLHRCSRLQSLKLDGGALRSGNTLYPARSGAWLARFATDAATCARLESLDLANDRHLSPEALRPFTALTRLALSWCDATDYTALSALAALTELDLSNCGVHNQVAKLPASLPALRALCLPRCTSPRALGRYPALEELRAPAMHGQLWMQYATCLPTACPRLRRLDLSSLAFVTAEFVAALVADATCDNGGGGGGGGDDFAAPAIATPGDGARLLPPLLVSLVWKFGAVARPDASRPFVSVACSDRR